MTEPGGWSVTPWPSTCAPPVQQQRRRQDRRRDRPHAPRDHLARRRIIDVRAAGRQEPLSAAPRLLRTLLIVGSLASLAANVEVAEPTLMLSRLRRRGRRFVQGKRSFVYSAVPLGFIRSGRADLGAISPIAPMFAIQGTLCSQNPPGDRRGRRDANGVPGHHPGPCDRSAKAHHRRRLNAAPTTRSAPSAQAPHAEESSTGALPWPAIANMNRRQKSTFLAPRPRDQREGRMAMPHSHFRRKDQSCVEHVDS